MQEKYSRECTISIESQSRAVSELLPLPELVCKYMEFKDFKRNLAAHTIRSYCSDLMQVFQLKHNCIIYGPKIDQSPTYGFDLIKSEVIPFTYQVTQDCIRSATRSWSDLSPKTRKRKISTLNGFIEWLKSSQKIDLGMTFFGPIKTPKKIPHFISVDECLSLVNHLRTAEESPALRHQRLLFALLYGAGLRVSEACEAQWQAFNFYKGHLKVRGKGGSERLAVLPQQLCKTIQDNGDSQGPWIWGAQPLNSRTAYNRVRNLGVAADLLKPLHPHALRHSYATHLLTSGSDLRVLQQLLGHKSLAATELYTHLDTDHLARTMEAHHPLSKINNKS